MPDKKLLLVDVDGTLVTYGGELPASAVRASGGPEARTAADYVTTGVDEDGLANAFAHFGIV